MNDRIQGLMAKARECVAAARAEFEAGRLNSAGKRAYYAMFHAARAALESRGIETGRQRHGTIIREFGRLFVKDGPLAKDHGRNLRKAQELRYVGDYEAEPPGAQEVAAAVTDSEAFVDVVEPLLRQR